MLNNLLKSKNLFNNIFKNDSISKNYTQRIYLIEEQQLEGVLANSFHKTILIFKHSTRCGISSMVLKRFENGMQKENLDIAYYFVDIIKNRELSNLIANKFNIRHESPQLLVLKNGEVIAHDSHYAILEVKY